MAAAHVSGLAFSATDFVTENLPSTTSEEHDTGTLYT
jgi:hypothetical protein